MKKEKMLIPIPKSRFLRVKCPSCGNEQIVFDHATFSVKCFVCNSLLAVPIGGKAKILGEIVRVLG
ncbi:MAG: 30S ribosomal protein S27e [Sulfolobales archaeon]|nr:30S ribosomal protein S27e [Sulfolobales archaeon]MDW8083487.1 30S ribosomal protein S27e [Sulfolobales archaeon]